MKKMMILLFVVSVMASSVWWYKYPHQKAVENNSREATRMIWEVECVYSMIDKGDYRKIGEPARQIGGWANIWIKPVGMKRFHGIEAINISADRRTSNFEKYIALNPGDQLYFLYDREKPDGLAGHSWARYFHLWMVVPKEKIKDFPGDIRKHPEYRFYQW